MYVYCVYPAMSKSYQKIQNYPKLSETNVVLVTFNIIHCEMRADTVTVFAVVLLEYK